MTKAEAKMLSIGFTLGVMACWAGIILAWVTG